MELIGPRLCFVCAGDQASGATVVSAGLTDFFSGLTIDLQGPQLTYQSMAVVQSDGEALLDLRLSVRVLDFPPINLQF